jgi:hypothetical protein
MGGLGSTNSGGSRASSEYSLTRSKATYRTSVQASDSYGRNAYHTHFETNEAPYHEEQLHRISNELVKCHINILTSPVIVEANAKANPASEAEMPGVRTAINAVTPTTALESMVKRADNQRFTGQIG